MLDRRQALEAASPPLMTAEPWDAAGLRYHEYNFFLRRKFGERVQKVSIDAGFTCPNVDGTVARGGCVFCDNRSFSPSRRVPKQAILDQIDDGISRLKRRYVCDKFLAYFQPATNTYGSLEKLRSIYEAALSHPQVVGLAIGTRSDCVPDETLDLIEELARRAYVCVEFGLQTIHDRTLAWMNRGHDYANFLDAIERSRGRGFSICAHVMLGLPGETPADMLATAREVARLKLDAVKLHNLYVVRNTPLADDYLQGRIALQSRSDYVATAIDFLELLPPATVVERLSGEAPPDWFLGPAWAQDKPALRDAFRAEFLRRDTRQGTRYEEPQPTDPYVLTPIAS